MKIKRTLAAILTLTMTAGLAACGDDSSSDAAGSTAESSVSESSNAEESTGDSSSEAESSTADESAADSGTEQSGDYQMMSFSGEHEPFGIKFDFALPKLEKYEPAPDDARNPDYFNYGVTYHYKYRTDDASLYGIRADVYAGIYNAENAAGYYKAKEGQQTDKTDNGYGLQYYIDEKEDSKKDTNGKHFYGHIAVYGETYRDAVLCCSVMFETYESDLSKDELEKVMLATANSIKFTDWDENALLKDDGSFISYQHHCTVPAKMTIAGTECEAKLSTQGSDPLVYTDVIEGSNLFRVTMDPFLLVGSSFENAKEKDKYTPATVNGCEALYAFEENSATGEFMIKISDDHIEKVVITIPSMANGQMRMDGKSFFDVRKEIAADPEAAKAKYNEFANDFVKAWIPDAE
jgi:hypothetical protein